MDSSVLKQTNKKFLWEQIILEEFYTYVFKTLKEYVRLWHFKTLKTLKLCLPEMSAVHHVVHKPELFQEMMVVFLEVKEL